MMRPNAAHLMPQLPCRHGGLSRPADCTVPPAGSAARRRDPSGPRLSTWAIGRWHQQRGKVDAASGGIEAEGRAAGQDHGVDPVDQRIGTEQFGLVRAGRAAADIDRGHRRPLGQHHRRAAVVGPIFGGVINERAQRASLKR
jgi:hypothetical protein